MKRFVAMLLLVSFLALSAGCKEEPKSNAPGAPPPTPPSPPGKAAPAVPKSVD